MKYMRDLALKGWQELSLGITGLYRHTKYRIKSLAVYTSILVCIFWNKFLDLLLTEPVPLTRDSTLPCCVTLASRSGHLSCHRFYDCAMCELRETGLPGGLRELGFYHIWGSSYFRLVVVILLLGPDSRRWCFWPNIYRVKFATVCGCLCYIRISREY